MRYVGQDKNRIYIKCGNCKTIQSYEKTDFYEQKKRKCPDCERPFSFVWGLPWRSQQISAIVPFLVMVLLGGLIIFLLIFPAFQRHYYFNKIVTALQPLYISILVSVLCSAVSFFFSKQGLKVPKEDIGKSSESDNKRHMNTRTIVNFVAVSIACIILILLMTVIIQIQYSSLEIIADGTDEIQQYYGNAIGNIASGNGRLFNSQGQLIYWGEFKDGLYDGYGEKYENIKNIHSANELDQYQCVYQGYFKSGLPYGEGKEYKYDTEYVFEKEEGLSPYLHYHGEFANGEYHGNGTLYNTDSKYSGVFYNKKYNGYGRLWLLETSDDRVFLIEGTFVDGVPQGMGHEYWPNGNLQFDGTYENGVKASGISYYESGNIQYDGDRNSDNKYSGKGTFYWENGNLRYDGDWVNGQRHGSGKSYREDGTLEYSGGWEADQYNGYGSEYYEDGIQLKYLGRFHSGAYSGYGTSYYEDRDNVARYSGEWSDGRPNGENIWYWENGNKYYEGTFDYGKMTGYGKQYSETEQLVYEGDFLNDNRHGYGTEYWNRTGMRRYKGEWVENQWSGEGTQFDENGIPLHVGQFREGKFIGESGVDVS